MLELPVKFKQALGNGVRTSLYPLVRIYKGVQIDDPLDSATEVINLSIKETNIGGEAYNPLLLNSPSIKSSADIINSKYTISSVSLSISNNQYNGKIFSDDVQSLLNAVVQVYYASNGIDTLDDCLLVYTGTIRRYNQSAETVSLTLEDLTQQKLATQIPSTTLQDEDLYSEEQIGQPYPMVYGYVDKSPTVINKLNDIELDKPNKELFNVWNAANKISFKNPYIDNQHVLIVDNWLNENASLSVYNDGYMPIMEELGKKFGSREYPNLETTVYTFENANANGSAKFNLNENSFLYESYTQDEDVLVGTGEIGVPTRIYRPVEKVSFYAKNHSTSFYSDYNFVRSSNKFYGYTNNRLDNITKDVNAEGGDNDFSVLDDLYDDNWNNGDKTWWRATNINDNVAQEGEFTETIDQNHLEAGYDGNFNVDLIQNNRNDTGLHINSQIRTSHYESGGAYARLELNKDIGDYPCVTKILYHIQYTTPSNEQFSTHWEDVFEPRLYYQPVAFWVERQLLNAGIESNVRFDDMDNDNNNWHKYYDTEDWVTECQVPNQEHSFHINESERRYETSNNNLNGIAGTDYDNVIIGFGTTNAYDSIQWGMPLIKSGNPLQQRIASVMANLNNFYTLQDCLITDIYNQDYYASIVGRIDGSGEPIAKPQFILADILKNELNYEGNVELPDVDIEDNWIQSFTLNEQKEAKSFVEGLFKSSVYIPSFNSKGEFKFLYMVDKETNFTQYPVINNEDIIKYSFSLTKLDDVKNQVNVKYKKDYGSGDYLEETGYGITDNNGTIRPTLEDVTYTFEGSDNNYDINYYGLKSEDAKLEFESEYIRDELTARKLQRKLLMWHCNQHLIAKIDLPPTYMNLEIGDTIRFDELIGGKLAFGQDYTQEIIKNGQPVYPIFFVNKITKSLDKVSIEAVQIHRGELGFDDEMASNYIIPNPYDQDIYEPEVDTETILNVNWATGTNFATEPLTAIIDTDIQGDIDVNYWLREVNVPAGTVDLEYGNTSSTYENGTWEIGEMPQIQNYIFNETIIQNDDNYGGSVTLTNAIENSLELAEQYDGFTFEIHFTMQVDIYNDLADTKYLDFSFIPFLAQGDITGDQVVNVLDIVAMVQFILGLTDLSDAQFSAGDVNDDGIINVQDVVATVQSILGNQ